MDESGRTERALCIGLCDSRMVLSSEQRIELDRDLAALHAARAGVKASATEEVIH